MLPNTKSIYLSAFTKKRSRNGSYPSSNLCEEELFDRRKLNHEGVRKGFDFLTKHCSLNINVSDIVVATGLSRRGLYKAFMKHTGISPGKALRFVRLETAKGLLCDSKYDLAKIADICGFRNTNSFWVSFRNAEGISPGKFRKDSRLADRF